MGKVAQATDRVKVVLEFDFSITVFFWFEA